jgi:hypothetical protein
MENTDGNALINRFGISGYPSGIIDRRRPGLGEDIDMSRGDWVSQAGEAANLAAPAKVAFDTVMYDTTTREIKAVLRSDFYTELSGDYRMSVAVVEDSVSAPNNSDYDQVNYSNTSQGHPYQGAGDPIVGFVHRHVMREYIGGPFGKVGSITGTIQAGKSSVDTFTYQVPQTIGQVDVEPKQISLVGMAMEYNGSGIDGLGLLNATKYELKQAIPVISDRAQASAGLQERLSLYPNPAHGSATLDLELNQAQNIQVQVLSVTGQTVYQHSAQQPAGSSTIQLPLRNANGAALSPGMYMVKVQSKQGSTTRKLMVR